MKDVSIRILLIKLRDKPNISRWCFFRNQSPPNVNRDTYPEEEWYEWFLQSYHHISRLSRIVIWFERSKSSLEMTKKLLKRFAKSVISQFFIMSSCCVIRAQNYCAQRSSNIETDQKLTYHIHLIIISWKRKILGPMCSFMSFIDLCRFRIPKGVSFWNFTYLLINSILLYPLGFITLANKSMLLKILSLFLV